MSVGMHLTTGSSGLGKYHNNDEEDNKDNEQKNKSNGQNVAEHDWM